MKEHKDNPAKVFLWKYRSLCGRIDALQMAINAALDRATNTALTLKEVKVLSSPAEHDPMAKDICTAVDACEVLYARKEELSKSLQDILDAIESVPDERQKELLTYRYINEMNFQEIMEKLHYEKTYTYVMHGRALVEINKWLKKRGMQSEW